MGEIVTSSFVYGLAKDLINFLRGQRRALTPSEKLALRDKWREPFANEIYRCRSEQLRQDVIIHDVKRLDQYPETKDDKGISAWFRLGLVGQYHRGIEVALGIHAIIYEESESHWRIADYDIEKNDSLNSYLIGFIPYEAIESVSWDGDEYYNFPHIFCHFMFKGQPYEKVSFCERKTISTGHVFFTELDTVNTVKLTSQKFGTSKFFWKD